jgi:hypothetical protein
MPPAPRPAVLPPMASHVPQFPHDDTAPTRVKEDNRLPSWSPSGAGIPVPAPVHRSSPIPPPTGVAAAPIAFPSPPPMPRDDPSWTKLEPTTSSGVRALDTVPPAAGRDNFWKRPGLLPGFVAGFVVGGLVVIALVRLLEPEDPSSSVTTIASPPSTSAPAGSHGPTTVKPDDLPPAIFRIQDLPSAKH